MYYFPSFIPSRYRLFPFFFFFLNKKLSIVLRDDRIPFQRTFLLWREEAIIVREQELFSFFSPLSSFLVRFVSSLIDTLGLQKEKKEKKGGFGGGREVHGYPL